MSITRSVLISRPLGVLLVVCLISACAGEPSRQLYTNAEVGIELVASRNWDITFYERSGAIVLQTNFWVGNNKSARIEILGNACIPTPAWFKGSREEIEANIERIRILYGLDSVTILQEATMIVDEENEVLKAIVVIPTMSLPKNDARNQIGEQDPGLFQTMEIFAISNKNRFIMAYVYKGNSEELNSEAEEIVASIQLTCSD